MTPTDIRDKVAAAYSLPPDVLARAGDVMRARQVWVYLMAGHLPLPDTYPAKAGSRRKRTDRDGSISTIAEMLGLNPGAVRNAVRRIEDRRDDPAFDAELSALEAQITQP